ncbi:hypothetical protein OIV19_18410 [Brucella sp. HL-2]|nr:hypothetical protein [Brucella sp. HL-2]MCV9909577.1 hypothetical protein [Brucella sp. HL-2]
MLYKEQIKLSPILEKLREALVLSSRSVGDIISSYALAHNMIAYNEHLLSGYSTVDALAAEVDEQFQLLKTAGSVSVIRKIHDNPAEEPIAYYRIEDSGFFWPDAQHFINCCAE